MRHSVLNSRVWTAGAAPASDQGTVIGEIYNILQSRRAMLRDSYNNHTFTQMLLEVITYQ